MKRKLKREFGLAVRTAAVEVLESRALLSTTMVPGDLDAGHIQNAAQVDTYVFNVTQGSDVQINTLGNQIDPQFTARFVLTNPLRGQVDDWTTNNTHGESLNNAMGGEYTLTVSDSHSTSRGTYGVGLVGITPVNASAEALSNGKILDGKIGSALEEKEYVFSTPAGSDFTLSTISSGTGFTGSFNLYDSKGGAVDDWTTNNAVTRKYENAAGGQYLLMVRDHGLSAPGDFSVGLETQTGPFSPDIQALTFGGIKDGKILNNLEVWQYGFAAAAGSGVVIQTVGAPIDSGFTASFSLFNSAGTVVGDSWTTDNPQSRLFSNLPAGNYMLEVQDHSLIRRGDFSVGLEVLTAPFSPDAKPLTLSGPTTGQVGGSLDVEQYVFSVSAETSVILATSGSPIDSGFNADFALVNSAGTQIDSWVTNNSVSRSEDLAPGQYALVVSDHGLGSRGSFTISTSGFGSPKAVVSANGVTIVNGDGTPAAADDTELGATPVGTPVSATYTVSNTGTGDLSTGSLSVPAGFTVTEPLDATIPAGASDTFTVSYSAAAPGTGSGNVSFVTNDSAADPYTFAIDVTALPPPPPDGPDLVIEGGVLDVKPGNFLRGAHGGKATVNVFNRGSQAAAGQVQVAFYASSDPTLDVSQDRLITTVGKNVNLPVGSHVALSAKFDYPDVPKGDYFIIAQVDPAGTFAETNEANNVAGSPVPVGLGPPDVDFIGSALKTTGGFKTGKRGAASLTVTNTGTAKSSGAANVLLFASTDNILGNDDDILIGTAALRSLKARQSETLRIVSDLKKLKSGSSYDLIASINPTGSVKESDLTNNTVFGAAPVTMS